MSILKLNSSNLSSRFTQNNLRGFKGTNRQAKEDNNIVTSFEEDKSLLLFEHPDNQLKNATKNSIKILCFGVPVTDSILKSASQQGSLSKRIFAFSKTLGTWSAVIASGVALMGLKNVVNSNFKKLDEFDKKHYIASAAIDFSAFMLAAHIVARKVYTLKENFLKKYSKTINHAAQSIDSSYINKRFVSNFDKSLNKNFYNNKALRFTSAFAAPVMLISVISGIFSAANRRQQDIQNQKEIFANN